MRSEDHKHTSGSLRLSFKVAAKETKWLPSRLELALADVIAALDQRDVQISIIKKESDSIHLQVSVKFAG